MVRVEREEPALPVLLDVDGQWVEGFVVAWITGYPDRQPRASVEWTEMRDYGYRAKRLGTVTRDQLKPREG